MAEQCVVLVLERIGIETAKGQITAGPVDPDEKVRWCAAGPAAGEPFPKARGALRSGCC